MSNVSLILEEKAVSIGNFMVGRLLPFKQKRSVGPFVFIDHMGPITAEEDMDILSHPHIGLSTLTYLFEGAMLHRDSLGTEMVIRPGAVNWMTAGKGVVHSERMPKDSIGETMHGLQIWVALPKELEQMEPRFSHVSAEEIPAWEENGVSYKVIAGEALGHKSPVDVYSPLYFIEIKSTNAVKLKLGDQLYGESAMYILHGEVKSGEETYVPKHIMITQDATLCEFEMAENTTLYLFGGEPFPEERFIHWNFVSSERELIDKAREDWEAQRFPKVPNEVGYIPLPELTLKPKS